MPAWLTRVRKTCWLRYFAIGPESLTAEALSGPAELTDSLLADLVLRACPLCAKNGRSIRHRTQHYHMT